MKFAIRIAVVCFGLTLAGAVAAQAQVPYAEGNVERVVLLHTNAGHSDALLADFKANVVPIWEAEKKAGIVIDYQMFFNTSRSGSDDWDFGYALVYKNMASLDGLADKVYGIRMDHYGDTKAEQKVIEKRVENAHIVNSWLIRDITLR